MMRIYQMRLPKLVMVMAACWAMAACSSNNSNGESGVSGSNTPVSRTFRITVSNISHNQPLSPAAVVVHSEGFVAWRIGETVSVPFEILAEGGDPSDFIRATQGHPSVLSTATGSGVIPPGASDSVVLNVTSSAAIHLSVASMLVNTNDAFTGLDEQSLEDMGVGQSASFLLPAYDPGTESNREGAANVPGPAAGGEGFNAVRDDSDYVRIHPGVVSAQDGLDGSALDGSHRWDNPVARVTIARTG